MARNSIGRRCNRLLMIQGRFRYNSTCYRTRISACSLFLPTTPHHPYTSCTDRRSRILPVGSKVVTEVIPSDLYVRQHSHAAVSFYDEDAMPSDDEDDTTEAAFDTRPIDGMAYDHLGLHGCTSECIKDICRMHGLLQVNGAEKEDLIRRLVDLEYDQFKGFTVKKLKVICTTYRLLRSGRKDDLIRRIIDHYQAHATVPVSVEEQNENDSSTKTTEDISDSEETDMLSEGGDDDSDWDDEGYVSYHEESDGDIDDSDLDDEDYISHIGETGRLTHDDDSDLDDENDSDPDHIRERSPLRALPRTKARQSPRRQSLSDASPTPPIVDYCFDRSQNYALVPTSELRHPDHKVKVGLSVAANDVDSLLDIMPAAIREALQDDDVHKSQLMEIVLDLGRRPFSWLIVPTKPMNNNQDASPTSSTSAELEGENEGKDGDSSRDSSTFTQSNATTHSSRTLSSSTHNRRIYIGDDNLKVTRAMLDSISHRLTFGGDNRAGLDGSLHRISAVRNRDRRIVGLTLRVGRHVPGNALMVADLLYRQPNLSVLFVGPPGTGKTSIIRDAAQMLAERQNVVIVDTSCEIGGAGDVPHACIGRARRMQVPSIHRQANVMIECVQNHTPQVMVIDEIGREAEVKAALTCHERGVRILASAHGTMAGLVRNTQLCDLLGGVETVTVGDKTANKQSSFGGKVAGAKLRAERRGTPIFDVVIELRPGQLHEWHVVHPAGAAVDSILSTGFYTGQIRRRGLDSEGQLQIYATHVDANRNKVLEAAYLRETQFAQNRVPRHNSQAKKKEDIQTGDGTSCPVCRKTFKRKIDMLQHVLKKKTCLNSLGKGQRADLKKELIQEYKRK